MNEQISRGAISGHDNFCDGFFSHANQGDGYFIAPILAVGKDLIKFANDHNATLLDKINAFDIAEVSGTYLGQINMITVSSFCGPQGLIWGHDVARVENKEVEYSVSQQMQNTAGETVPVYSMGPVLYAGTSLFGTRDNLIYPIMPGSHVPCAAKQLAISGPEHIYCAIGFGIPEDRRQSAVTIMEDVGSIYGTSDLKEDILDRLARSILQIGINQNIVLREIFVSVKTLEIKEGEIGCALVAVPYFALAKRALCGKNLAYLSSIPFTEWQKLNRSYLRAGSTNNGHLRIPTKTLATS